MAKQTGPPGTPKRKPKGRYEQAEETNLPGGAGTKTPKHSYKWTGTTAHFPLEDLSDKPKLVRGAEKYLRGVDKRIAERKADKQKATEAAAKKKQRTPRHSEGRRNRNVAHGS